MKQWRPCVACRQTIRMTSRARSCSLQDPTFLRRLSFRPEEREAIARSKAAASRGEFATDEQVQAVWAKHGL